MPASRAVSMSTLGLLGAAVLLAALSAARAEDADDDLAAKPAEAAIDPAGRDFFEKKIRPLLADRCYKCHSEGAAKVRGGLLLDTREGIRRGGDSGPAVVPGKPGESLLLEAVRYENKDFQMPPKTAGGKLPDEVIHDVEKWITMGAPDPRDGASRPAPKEDRWQASRDLWAWNPPVKPAAPEVRFAAWPRTDIDRFVLAGLEAKGLRPGPDADKATLLRRVFFDLVGLPPSPEELDAFLADSSPGAFASVVDKLLASPRFGERWGRHWLDVARYAESTGKEVNIAYPHAWRYRDYVYASFNADKPYDRFVREQIAGDLLPAKDERERAENEIATGFLALGPKSLNERSPRQFRVDLADEQIDALSQGFLGVTVSCARCHDHKFDPIPQSEYYSLAGILLSTETRYGTVRALQNRHGASLVELPASSGQPVVEEKLTARERERLEERLASLKAERAEIFGGEPPDMGRRLKRRGGIDGLDDEMNGDEKPPERPARRPPGDLKAARTKAAQAGPRLIALQSQIGMLENRLRSYDADGNPKVFCMGVRERLVTLDSPVFARGDVEKPGERVPRGFVSVLSGGKAPLVHGRGSGRLELAEWIVAPENPLAARVIVNRVWHWIFGRGIVASVDNFGYMGSRPDNQPLLDHLAVRFREEGWSIKKLIREIVTSRVYALSSAYDEKSFAADPENSLCWRRSKQRLDAECLRDALLAAGGALDTKPPVGSAVARAGDGPIMGRRPMAMGERDVNADVTFRSAYLPIPRDMVPDVLDVFDFAEPALVTGAREATNVPSQALYLLNSPFVAAQAEKTAQRIISGSHRGEDDRIAGAYRLILSRPPTDAERRAAHEFFASFPARESPAGNGRERKRPAARKPKDANAPWTSFCRALFGTSSFRYLD